MNNDTSARPAISVSSALIMLLGLWLIISPWVLGPPGPRVATSGIVCGALIVVCSAIRFAYRHTSAMSWINALLGAWIIGSAWVFGENGPDVHTWNYVIVGVIVAGLETLSLTSSAMRPRASPGLRHSRDSPRHQG